MIYRRISGGSTFKAVVVGCNEMGLHVLPIFVVGIVSVPRCDAVCEDPGLLNFIQCLVQYLGHRVRQLRYDSLDEQLFKFEKHVFNWLAGVSWLAPLLCRLLLLCGRSLTVPALQAQQKSSWVVRGGVNGRSHISLRPAIHFWYRDREDFVRGLSPFSWLLYMLHTTVNCTSVSRWVLVVSPRWIPS